MHSGPRTLTVKLSTTGFTDEQLLKIRKICSDVSSDPLLIEHCLVDLESAEYPSRRIAFKTTEPEAVWIALRALVDADDEIGERFARQSTAYWQGMETQDCSWIHRPLADSN